MRNTIPPAGFPTVTGNPGMFGPPPALSTNPQQQRPVIGGPSDPCFPVRPQQPNGVRPPAPGSEYSWTREAQRAIKTLDDFISANGLNEYGDAKGTMYAGGTPLFNEATGKRISREAYILGHHPGLVLNDALVNRVKDAARGVEFPFARDPVPAWKNNAERKHTLYVPVTVVARLPNSADMFTVTAWLPSGERTDPSEADHLYLHQAGGFAGVSSWVGPVAFSPVDVVKAGAEANGKTVSVPKNSAFVLELPSNPTTGYRWSVASVDRSFGSPTEKYLPDDAPEGMVGVGGVQRFTWGTTQPWLEPGGRHTVELQYKRPWEDAAVGNTSKFKVTVAITDTPRGMDTNDTAKRLP